ncbi:MAG TPA: hypothetical protein EYH09_01815 [Candidatus Nanopusillus sp.]|nr:hypothetical protein [Candidatus Nanopusillus sp.]HIP90497.1 hypothetical protein [Candidatus Nanopusillus sp.]
MQKPIDNSRICVICKEPIWNPISPKMAIYHALSVLDTKYWNRFLNEIIKELNIHRFYFKERMQYLDGEIDVPICWGCLYDLIYEILEKIDKKSAEEFKKFACPYGL